MGGDIVMMKLKYKLFKFIIFKIKINKLCTILFIITHYYYFSFVIYFILLFLIVKKKVIQFLTDMMRHEVFIIYKRSVE